MIIPRRRFQTEFGMHSYLTKSLSPLIPLFTFLSRSVNVSHQPISQFGSRDGTKTDFSCADQKQVFTKGDFGCGKGLEVSLETIP